MTRPLMLRFALALLLVLAARLALAAPGARAVQGLATCGAPATPAAVVPSASPAALGAGASPAPGAALTPIVDIPLPGGATRFDYQSLDPTTGTLWIAHMGDGSVISFDTASRSVAGVVSDLPGVTGVLAVPALRRVFAAVSGAHQVAVIDAASRQVIARVGRIGFPDGLDLAPAAHRVFVSDESGGGETVIDAASDRVVATIDIGGEAGNTRYDPGSGCVLVTVQSRGRLVAIDPASATIAGQVNLDQACHGPHGLVLDAPRRLAFIGCEDNATLLVVDLTTLRSVATFPVGDRPDVLAVDPGWARLYVASETGTVSLFDERGGRLQPAGTYDAPHAHSIAVDPATHLVYLPLENVGGKPVLRILEAGPPAR